MDTSNSRHLRRLVVICLALFCGAVTVCVEPIRAEGTPSSDDSVPPIILKAIEFHGGEAYTRSRTELDMCSKSGCFHVSSRVQGDAFEHDVSGLNRDTHIQVRIDNDSIARWFDGHPSQVPEAEEQRYRDWAMARVYFCFLPYRLADSSVRHKDMGVVTWNDRKLHLVEVSFEPGSSTDANDMYRYWFDPESGRLELFAYSYEGEPGGLRFRRIVEHRRVGGILFFDQENLGVEGEDLSIDMIDPAYVEEAMRPISEVKLRNIRVTPLP